MDLVIDLSSIINFFNQPADIIAWKLFFIVGWIPIAWVILWGILQLWLDYIGNQWAEDIKFVLLAVDVPKNNLQTPKAVENMISYLAGAHGTNNLIEDYWIGKFQLQFALEIVSIEGYIQYLIYTPESFRDLVEAAVYSQYPDAEITEVEDYTESAPSKFPDDAYDIWGGEFIYAQDYVLPFRTYPAFLDTFPGEPETQHKDPASALMSLMSGLGPGEQLWYQIIIRPRDMFDWVKKGEDKILEILGNKPVRPPDNIVDKIAAKTLGWLDSFGEFIYSLWGDIADTAKADEKPDANAQMLALSKPKEKKQVEVIQNKISKIGFDAKVRMIYLAKKEVMNKGKVLNGFVGYLKQFVDVDLNNLKPDMNVTATSVAYFLVEDRLNMRKNKIMQAYKGRSVSRGRLPGIMCTEEIATLWHFPVEQVSPAPLLQKTPGRKVEAPMNLPREEENMDRSQEFIGFNEDALDKIPQKEQNKIIEEKPKENIFEDQEDKGGAPPANLPFA